MPTQKNVTSSLVASNVTALLLVLALAAHSASAPMPPCLEGGGCLNEPYDLGSVPFAFSWPDPPITQRTIEVTTIEQFRSAVQQSNARVLVAAGNYRGNLNVTGSDLDIVVSNNATITGVLVWGNGLVSQRPARIRWTGGNLIDGGMQLQPIEDLLVNDFFIDNLASNSPEGIHNLTGLSGVQRQGWNRMAWINSTIRLRGGSSAGGWAFYTSPNGGSDLILANVKVQTTAGQNNRFMGVRNLIIVDSAFNPDGLSANGMRIHNSSSNVFMRDSIVRGIFKMDPVNQSDTGPQVINGTFLRVSRFDATYGSFAFQGLSPNSGSVRDSIVYSGSGGGAPSVSPMTGSGNRVLAWDGNTMPDYSHIGARR
ncbi:MAG: hypothetical protein KF911_12050 [Pseudomonadales bacterium]|nr:hypothetical protein [Pseudomonadales bacterium]